LKDDIPESQGAIYIIGDLTNWNYTKEAKMKYNLTQMHYENKLYLKQGYYNYQYIFLQNNSNVGDVSFIEGNHYETENDYFIIVYYTDKNKLYDRVLGVKTLNSKSNR
jgi:hypothetical protein